MNIIGLDWYQVQLHNDYNKIYDCTTGFGEVVGSFLSTLIRSHGLKTSKLTVVGHSIAGAFCASIVPHIGKVRHMVGLETGHIGTQHANYVQVCSARNLSLIFITTIQILFIDLVRPPHELFLDN